MPSKGARKPNKSNITRSLSAVRAAVFYKEGRACACARISWTFLTCVGGPLMPSPASENKGKSPALCGCKRALRALYCRPLRKGTGVNPLLFAYSVRLPYEGSCRRTAAEGWSAQARKPARRHPSGFARAHPPPLKGEAEHPFSAGAQGNSIASPTRGGAPEGRRGGVRLREGIFPAKNAKRHSAKSYYTKESAA